MDVGKIALLLLVLFGLGMLQHYAFRYAERADNWLRRHSWRDPFRGNLADRLRQEAADLDTKLQSLLAQRNRDLSNRLDEAGLRLDPLVARELARFLVLRRALPWRRYRIFGPTETFWTWLSDQDDGATLLQGEGFAPRELRTTGEWRQRYVAFLADYARVFPEPADPGVWASPPGRGTGRQTDIGYVPHVTWPRKDEEADGNGVSGDGGLGDGGGSGGDS